MKKIGSVSEICVWLIKLSVAGVAVLLMVPSGKHMPTGVRDNEYFSASLIPIIWSLFIVTCKMSPAIFLLTSAVVRVVMCVRSLFLLHWYVDILQAEQEFPSLT